MNFNCAIKNSYILLPNDIANQIIVTKDKWGYLNNQDLSLNKVNSFNDSINNIVKLTQAEYDAFTPDSKTLYIIEN